MRQASTVSGTNDAVHAGECAHITELLSHVRQTRSLLIDVSRVHASPPRRQRQKTLLQPPG